MKKQSRIRSLRLYFILMVFLGVIVSVLLAGAVYELAESVLNDPLDKIPGMLQIAIYSCITGPIVAAVFSSRIVKPIKKLTVAANKVAERDFTARVDDTTRLPEMRELYQTFNMMVEELERTDALRNDFVAGVSHEFKTPINAIEGYATLLQDPDMEYDERRECVDKIAFNTHRLSSLVGNMLLISKLESGSIPYEKSEYRLDEQIRQSILALETKWQLKDIEFDVELEDVRYRGYEQLLGHVWQNLIDNAVKHSPQGGRIWIRLRTADDGVVFSIRDEGEGMPPEVAARAFEKFYQGDSSHKMEGNGLGLAIVKKVINLSYGQVIVRSKPGKGTEFTVTLFDVIK